MRLTSAYSLVRADQEFDWEKPSKLPQEFLKQRQDMFKTPEWEEANMDESESWKDSGESQLGGMTYDYTPYKYKNESSGVDPNQIDEEAHQAAMEKLNGVNPFDALADAGLPVIYNYEGKPYGFTGKFAVKFKDHKTTFEYSYMNKKEQTEERIWVDVDGEVTPD